MEIIKRYQNRKLYSTTLNHYIKLDYICDLVKTNQRFMVIDNKTKLDITAASKRQALMTLSFPDSLVTELIRSNA